MAKHSGWRITAQLTDQIDNTNAGQVITGVRVYFVTGNGNEGEVFIPNIHYNAKTVEQAVHNAASNLDGIGALHSGPVGQG